MNSLHYSPPLHWMNDPNGLIFHDGRYHMYYQHNPLGVEHENMSWGHASSADLRTWDDHPVALSFDDEEEVFSGSVVLDAENATGFGRPGAPALIALYTSASRTRRHQAQSLAYSLDGGLTWEKHAGNPVLDRDSAHFRDPKVIRWEGPEESYWVMLAVEAEARQVVLYRSEDLLSWTFLSAFGPEGAVGGVWECPDLFPLRVEGTGEVHWVMLVSLNPGGIAGGSGTQWFAGDFDGCTFTPHVRHPRLGAEDPAELRGLGWLDYGRDCYAGVTFAGLPDEERTLIAWMGNWDYAREMPLTGRARRRGSMTLPRRLSLVRTDGELRLRQVPVAPVMAERNWDAQEGFEAEAALAAGTAVPCCGSIELSISLGSATGFALTLEGGGGRTVVLSYDAGTGELALDRRGSAAGYPAGFAGVQRMPVVPRPEMSLVLWLDAHAVEVYAEGGTRVLTDLIGEVRAPRLRLDGLGGEVRTTRLVTGAVKEAVCC